jgi:ADP-ribose pyrophosphatase YjhB (NUDIX family)
MGKIEVIARGVCVVGESLLLCHSKGASNTFLPGGHVEFAERVRDALAREIAEELGRDCHVTGFLGCVENCFMQNGRRHAEINLLFRIDVDGVCPGTVPVSAEDEIEFLWHPVSDLGTSRLKPSVLRTLLREWHERGWAAAAMETAGGHWS